MRIAVLGAGRIGARWLLGREIEEVYVHGTNTPASDGEVLDLQVIQLKLGGGCLASIEVYVNAGYGYEVDLEVVGDAGTIHMAPANAPVLRKQRYAGHLVEGDWLERFPAAYVLEMQRWMENLRDGRLTGADARDGYTSLLAVKSCIASLHSRAKESFKSPRCPDPYPGEALPMGVRTGARMPGTVT